MIFKIVAILLIAAGVSGLVLGGFSYKQETQEAVIGPLEITVNDTRKVNFPIWVSVGGIVLGTGLLLFAVRKN